MPLKRRSCYPLYGSSAAFSLPADTCLPTGFSLPARYQTLVPHAYFHNISQVIHRLVLHLVGKYARFYKDD
jgi:hypothetical protein